MEVKNGPATRGGRRSRRAVGGLLLPYHIVTEGRSPVREDPRLDEIQVNPELSKGDFK
jgi:hypothetical protein